MPDRNGKIFYTSITSLSHISKDLCNQTERRFGEITAKTVLYRGESHNDVPDVEYRNAADFLKALPESMDIDQGQGFTMDLG